MKSRLHFLETLMPLLSQMARSPDPALAAEAMDEVALKSKELARLKRASAAAAESPTEGASRETALAA